jgi:hypothetical protein
LSAWGGRASHSSKPIVFFEHAGTHHAKREDLGDLSQPKQPSHIFARLGLWEEDIHCNLASKATSEARSKVHIGAQNRLHAMEFLEYAYLQIGQDEKARALVLEAAHCQRFHRTNSPTA